MGTIDTGKAERPTRGPIGGTDRERTARFRDRMSDEAKRDAFLRMDVYSTFRDAPINPRRTPIDDPEAMAGQIKALAREFGVDAVGIAAYDERFVFTQNAPQDHGAVIVFAKKMTYDVMAEVSRDSQAEVQRVYRDLDELGMRLSQRIGSFGYSARTHPNEGDMPLPALGWLAGIGELGKHGSLIAPELGSSFRLGAVSTDMPLAIDGPADHGIDEICANCNVCSRFCPGDAIRDEKMTVNGITRWHVDTPACEPWFHGLYGCKICLMVCPFNARGPLKAQFAATAKNLREAKDAEGLVRLFEEKTGERLRPLD